MRQKSSPSKLSWLGLLLLVACGPAETKLDGSLGDLVALDYERAEITLTQQTIVLKFLRARGTGDDTILKLSVFSEGATPDAEVTFDLSEQVAELGQRGTVTRHVFEDPNETLPPIRRGRLSLSGLPGQPGRVRGELSATFTQGHEFAAGRTVYGEFEAEVVP